MKKTEILLGIWTVLILVLIVVSLLEIGFLVFALLWASNSVFAVFLLVALITRLKDQKKELKENG